MSNQGIIYVKGYGTTTPPGSPADGDAYFVGASATGNWSGKDGNLAVSVNGKWYFTPKTNLTGAIIFDSSTNIPYLCDGTTTARKLTLENDAESNRFTFCFNSATATAVNAETSGTVNTSTNQAGVTVPTGKTLKIYACIGSIESGTVNGTYTVDLILRNVTDSTNVVLATGTYTVSGGVAGLILISSIVNPGSVLASLAAGKQFKVGWFNRNTSPGALTGTQKAVYVMGAFV